MKLEFPDSSVTIDDESLEAQKIKQGYDYDRDKNGRIRILGTQSRPNLEQIIQKLEAGEATNKQIQTILAHVIKKLL